MSVGYDGSSKEHYKIALLISQYDGGQGAEHSTMIKGSNINGLAIPQLLALSYCSCRVFLTSSPVYCIL